MLNQIGTIFKYKDKLDVRLAINDLNSLQQIINIFNVFSLLTIHQYKRFMLVKTFLIEGKNKFSSESEYAAYKELLSFFIDEKLRDHFVNLLKSPHMI